MPYNSKAFGIVISRLRVRKGLTQEAASGLAGIARSHLAMLENGRKTVRLDTLWRLAETLGVSASELVRLVEEESRG
ncbi:MAG: helix-turn-helix transcriptional regulator [Clostridia bacterium]|nr:helix-turn-helix transcriptional regulator [Clostridia bacterium]